jgi:hypothetical protein
MTTITLTDRDTRDTHYTIIVTGDHYDGIGHTGVGLAVQIVQGEAVVKPLGSQYLDSRGQTWRVVRKPNSDYVWTRN